MKEITDLSEEEIRAAIGSDARLVCFEYCVSLLLVTFKRSSKTYLVEPNESRTSQALIYSLISLTMGWWGIPWGPIYTASALTTNLRGGRDRTEEVMATFDGLDEDGPISVAQPPRVVSTVLSALAIGIVVFGAYMFSGQNDSNETSEPTSDEKASTAKTQKTKKKKRPKKKKKNARPTDEERGKELYERHCLACHGEKGRGDGPMGQSMVVDVPSMVGILKLDNLADYTQSVQKGKGSMPGFELSFDKHDTRRVLRTMIRRMEEKTTPSEESAEPSSDKSDASKPADSKSEN